MPNDLVTPADLADFPGAPFAESIVDAAVAALRADAGWHIAPERTETVLVDSEGGTRLFLPTLYLTSVTEVRNLLPDTPEVLDGYRKSRRGVLTYRCAQWPCGDESVEADIVHGYTDTPADLFIVVAEMCQLIKVNSRVRQESAGGESISYAGLSDSLSNEAQKIYNRYKIPQRF